MARIEISGFRKTFGELEIIPGVDLTIEDKDFVVFVGPSGCGKSTMLRLIAGLETPTAGKIEIDGVDVTNTPPSRRGLAMVFQSYALYPHMSVRGNMEFGLRMAKLPKPEIAERVDRAAEILGLTPMLDRRPGQMSGGQRQRVAIGRAIVRDPRAFLFDEPLSNLDAALRVQMRLEIARLHEELGATTIYVTHDQVEAMTMATRIVVLNAGRIEQAGSPLELYHHPANRFVAQFIGSPKMNVVPVAVAGAAESGLRVTPPGGSEIVVPVEGAADSGVPGFTLGARPEQISLTDKGGMPAEVKVVEHLGNTTLAYVEIEDGEMITAALDGSSPVRVHDKVQLAIDVDAAHLFDAAGQALAKRDRHPLVSPG